MPRQNFCMVRFRSHRFSELSIFLVMLLPVVTSLVGKSPAAAAAVIRRVVVVGGTHGNEYTGVWCIKTLERKRSEIKASFPSLDVSTLLGNPRAHLENKRFIDGDLNREFSEDRLLLGEEGLPLTVESLRAKEVDLILGPKFHASEDPQTDVVVDLHSTTSNMGVTLIIPEGDAVMAQAAAYVLHDLQNNHRASDDDEEHDSLSGEVRCVMHSIPKREHRPNLSSAARHGFTIEVGPVPQGILRHDAVERTQRAIASLLTFLHLRNNSGAAASSSSSSSSSSSCDEHNRDEGDASGGAGGDDDVVEKNCDLLASLQRWYPQNRVPCYRSAPATQPGEQMLGKIPWPKTDPDNPNFPAVMVHKSLQDRDFHIVRRGDPLFVTLDGEIIPYDGSHGDEVYLIFVNEGGYYYPSSGSGIGVAVKAEFDLMDGTLLS